MGSNEHEHEEGIEGVDLGCGLRREGVSVGKCRYEVLKPNCYTVAGLFSQKVPLKSKPA